MWKSIINDFTFIYYAARFRPFGLWRGLRWNKFSATLEKGSTWIASDHWYARVDGETSLVDAYLEPALNERFVCVDVPGLSLARGTTGVRTIRVLKNSVFMLKGREGRMAFGRQRLWNRVGGMVDHPNCFKVYAKCQPPPKITTQITLSMCVG